MENSMHQDEEILIAKPVIDKSFSTMDSVTFLQNEIAAWEPSELLDIDNCKKRGLHFLELGYVGGLANPTTVSEYKLKFLDAVAKLKKIRASEANLTDYFKELVLDNSKMETMLAKVDNYPEDYDSPADKIRQDTLSASNRAMEIDYCNESLDYTVAALEDEKAMLLREAKKFPTEEEIAACQNKMDREIQYIETQQQKLRMEARQLRHLLREKGEEQSSAAEQLAFLNQQIVQLSRDMDEPNYRPLETMQENVSIAKAIQDEAVRELDQLKLRRTNLVQIQTQVTVKNEQLIKTLSELQSKVNDYQTQIDGKKRILEEKISLEANLRTERTDLELKLESLRLEKSQLIEANNSRTRVRDAEIRKIRQATNSLQAIQDAVTFLKQTHDSKKQELEVQRMAQDRSILIQRQSLEKDISQLSNRIAQDSELSQDDQLKIQRLLSDKEKLMTEMEDEGKDALTLYRLVCIKSEETLQKMRYFETAKAHFSQVTQALKLQELSLAEPQKQLKLLGHQLMGCLKMYESINRDRNECLSLINLAHQTKLGLEEKFRLYNNELDILKSAIAHKQCQLQSIQSESAKITEHRSLLRTELSKQKQLNMGLTSESESIALSVRHLQKVHQREKLTIEELRKTYETMIRCRDDRGQQFIERNEEVCVLQEKLHLLEGQGKQANLDLIAREDELSILKLEKREQMRTVAVYKNQLSKHREIEKELMNTEMQLILARDHLAKLENLAADPNAHLLNSGTDVCVVKCPAYSKVEKHFGTKDSQMRLRLLKGPNPDLAILQEKLDDLTFRIEKVDVTLFEKQMVFDATEQLIISLKSKLKGNNEECRALAVCVNEHASTNTYLTKELKASIAELRMKITQISKFESDLKLLRYQVELAQQHLADGKPPSTEAREEWKRMERRKKVEKETQENIRRRQEEIVDPNDRWTTNECRPSIYVPDGICISHAEASGPDSINLVQHLSQNTQKAFGAFPRMKPSQPSKNMRHIRQPKPKPIEI